MIALPLAVRLARRELRGGWSGFRILVACLALGVAAIAASGSLRASFQKALDEDSRALLGGDIELRQSYQPISDDQRHLLQSLGQLSEGLDLRAMARRPDGEQRRLVEMKGVDPAYPLVGQVSLAPPMPLAEALARRDGVWGAAVDANLLDGLGLNLGQRLVVGELEIELRAVVTHEPDRVASVLAFGPRLLVSTEAVAETGLVQVGSVVRHFTRLALGPGHSVAEAKELLARTTPSAPWQLRDTGEAAPGVGRFLDNMAAFLTLVGLTALLVGGIGIANAVTAYLDGRTDTIATLKCLGAPSRLILATYGLLVGLMATVGIGIGLAAGASVPWLMVWLAGDRLPLAARLGLFPAKLAVAAALGLLTTLVFALWPLARARLVPATALFRQVVAPLRVRLDRGSLALLTIAAVLLIAVAIASAERKGLAGIFVAASLMTLALFRGLARMVSKGAAGLTGRGLVRHPVARLALANLHRPGSAVVSMVLSLGLGLTVLVTIALVEGNLARQFSETLPRQAPSFFFIDIQPDQQEPFAQEVSRIAPSARIEMAPLVRGRITRLNGRPIAELPIAAEAQWALRGDRGLSTAAKPPEGTILSAGQWWPEDYQGPPLASMDAGIAKGFGLKLGDTVTLNVLGRELTVTVASLREIQWSTLNMNFTFLLSPNTLAGAPLSWIATVHAPDGKEAMVERAVTDRFANVSAIRVKEALETVRAMIANADLAVRLAGLVTLSAGALVLAGAVMAGHRRRVMVAVILKVLGATRADLWRAWLLEFGIIGVITGLAAGAIGTLAARAILTEVMRADWTFLPGVAATTVAICVLASLLTGFAGTFAAIRAKAAPVLRAE